MASSLVESFGWAAFNYRAGLQMLAADFGAAVMGAAHIISDKAAPVLWEATLLEEGLVHINDVSPAIKTDLQRDALTCAVETGLSVAEEVALEVTLGIAAIETGEKILHTPKAERDFGAAAAGFFESVISSTAAAIHAAIDVAHDLERAGTEWRMIKAI